MFQYPASTCRSIALYETHLKKQEDSIFRAERSHRLSTIDRGYLADRQKLPAILCNYCSDVEVSTLRET
jgi:hypothetical protein